MKQLATSQLAFSELTLPLEALYRYLGYKDACPDPETERIVRAFFSELDALAYPMFGYRIVDGFIEGQTLTLVDVAPFETATFSPGRTISKCLEGCSQYILLLSTVGAAFNDWLQRIHDRGDILEMYISDAIGSFVAETVSEHAYQYLADEAEQSGLKLTNAYSPGYCDWHVGEQRLLFSLLPPAFCGITLNDSCLMHPIKSISNVIGLDPSARRRPYGCAICHRKDCFVRRNGAFPR